MTASVHILCGPAGSGKSRRLLEGFRTAAGIGPGQALWIGPTQRAVEAARRQWACEGGGSAAATFLTFQDFVEEIIRVNDPGSRPLSNGQRRLLADEIVGELHTAGELSHFSAVVETRGFAEGVFALLAELKRNEVWPGEFARAAYHRGYNGPHVAARHKGVAISVKDRQVARIYAQYQSRLIRHHLYDMEGRYWYARDLLASGVRKPFEAVRTIFLDDFVELTRTQLEILEALASEMDRIWLALADEPGDERGELFTRTRATLQRLRTLSPTTDYLSPPRASRNGKRARHRPAGLVHLERQLFRPPRAVEPSARADGLQVLEAPGMVGEVRMVAREIKQLLHDGTPAEDVLVTLRDLVPYADLVREVFAEYGIPCDVEGAEPLLRNPAVATLLRALRLPDEDWPFAAVTALLRSGYFEPDWPEGGDHPESMAQQSEVLLRLLAEPRGRAAYLRALDIWADRPPIAFEDEAGEASIRERKIQLARTCRPFLRRYFQAWEHQPVQGTFEEHLNWLRDFAENLGLARTAASSRRDAAAWARLWSELECWAKLRGQLGSAARRLDRAQFQRQLLILAAETGLARTPRGPGRVRVLSTQLARALEVPYLFVLGLGERSFPRLVSPEPFFDEAERQAFRQAGLDFSTADDLMPDEMLLFYQVVTRATQRLVLSYPAVDDKGQALLPSSFLTALTDCFTDAAIARHQRRMLVEGLASDHPLSPAEHRIRVARQLAEGKRPAHGLPKYLADNITAAAHLVHYRLHERDYNPYDGMLRHPAVVAALQELFHQNRVLSPTALEEYVACPFRFFFDHVLGLEPLEDPSEEVESTDRGLVFHRALLRLHTDLHKRGINGPEEIVGKLVVEQLERAVSELAERASPAGSELWRLEGARLKRKGERYKEDWARFTAMWQELGVRPRPAYFEKAFGLRAVEGEEMAEPLVLGGGESKVRIGGRIDRIDVAEVAGRLAFWIIDYKTGRSSHYTASSLRSFQRLQLTLYALAAERVLLKHEDAQPLALAYWLVTDTGPKVVLPGDRKHEAWHREPQRWHEVRRLLEDLVVELVGSMRSGAFPLKPRAEDCTDTCPFSQSCRITQSRSVEKTWSLPLPTIS